MASAERTENKTGSEAEGGQPDEADEFEDFPAEEWQGGEDDPECPVWEDNWEDDDDLEEDFQKQLVKEKCEIPMKKKMKFNFQMNLSELYEI